MEPFDLGSAFVCRACGETLWFLRPEWRFTDPVRLTDLRAFRADVPVPQGTDEMRCPLCRHRFTPEDFTAHIPERLRR